MAEGESIRNIIPVDDFDDDSLYLTLITRYGVIKKTALSKYSNINKNGLIATNIREGDSVVAVQLTKGGGGGYCRVGKRQGNKIQL